MRKRRAAFADNAQAALALPDKHTRKQKECGGGSHHPARGPQLHHRGVGSRLGVTHHPEDFTPLDFTSLCTAQVCGCLLAIVAPTKCWERRSASRDLPVYGACPCIPIPRQCDGMSWQG